MAILCSNYSLLWALLISFFGVSVCNSAEFPKIEHYSRNRTNSVAFLAVGDWGRGGYFNQSATAAQMGEIGRKLGIDFVISTGDNFYHTGLKGVKDPLFQRSFSNIYTAKSLHKPWYTVLGNHDYLGNTEAQLSQDLQKLDRRWHCFRNFIVQAGFVHIFFIDTTPFVDAYFANRKNQTFDWRSIMPRDKYLSYVKNNLDFALKNSRAKWKIVVGHHAIRSIGYHGDTEEIVKHVLPILEANKVDMYINGHDHCLEHLSNKNGSMQFFTSGGGSKAWKNIIHREKHNDTTRFYYDGQGFLSVQLTKKKAFIAFYNVFGKPLYSLNLYSVKFARRV